MICISCHLAYELINDGFIKVLKIGKGQLYKFIIS